MASNREIAHKFAHRHEHGPRTGSNMYYEFCGSFPVIYSYGHHFPMAVLGPVGSDFYLWYESSYSVTTSTHQSYTAAALSHKVRVSVFSKPTNYIQGNELNVSTDQKRADLTGYNGKLQDLVERHNRARMRSYEDEIKDWLEQAARYVDVFRAKNVASGLVRRFIRSGMDAEAFARELIADKGPETETRKEKAIQAALRRFRAGKANSVPGRYTYLRLNGDYIETSKGIRIGKAEAIAKAGAIRRMIEAATEGRTLEGSLAFNGWQIDRVTSAGDVIAGCHTVKRVEIERILRALV